MTADKQNPEPALSASEKVLWIGVLASWLQYAGGDTHQRLALAAEEASRVVRALRALSPGMVSKQCMGDITDILGPER